MRRLSAGRIASSYVAGAAAWIVVTDWLIDLFHVPWLATWKGMAFVAITGAVLYVYLRRKFDTQERIERALQDAAENKSRLITAVSHDLRQPLQSLSLFATVIEGGDLPPKSRAALDKMRRSLDRMGQLLTEVLDLAKLDVGALAGKRERVEINQVLTALVEEMRPQVEAKGLRLKWVPTTAVVESDFTLLTTILRNLLANATKYTEKGKVLVGCRHHGGDLLISVYDTGMGIEEDKLKLIFEDFYQVGNVARDTQQGLGLGLSIVERLTRMLGYRVIVRSQKGRGSAFSLVVPKAAHWHASCGGGGRRGSRTFVIGRTAQLVPSARSVSGVSDAGTGFVPIGTNFRHQHHLRAAVPAGYSYSASQG